MCSAEPGGRAAILWANDAGAALQAASPASDMGPRGSPLLQARLPAVSDAPSQAGSA